MSDIAIEQEYIRAQRRSFNRIANLITALTFPMVLLFYLHQGKSLFVSVILASGVLVLRGVLDLAYRRLIPLASLYGTNDAELRADDALQRRRLYFWSKKLRWIVAILTFIT